MTPVPKIKKPKHAAGRPHLMRARAAIELTKAANRLEGELPKTAHFLHALSYFLTDTARHKPYKRIRNSRLADNLCGLLQEIETK